MSARVRLRLGRDEKTTLLPRDAVRVAASRRLLRQAGVYGARVAVHQVESLDELPMVEGFADLVVSTDGPAVAAVVLRIKSLRVCPESFICSSPYSVLTTRGP